MVKDPLVLHHQGFSGQLFQDMFCQSLREKVTLPHCLRILASAVIKHPAHNVHGCLLVPIQKRLFVLFPLLRRNPYARFHIGNQFSLSQILKPLHRHRQFSGYQIALHHQEGVKLFLVLRKFLPFLKPGKFLRLRLYHVCCLQFLVNRFADSLCNR